MSKATTRLDISHQLCCGGEIRFDADGLTQQSAIEALFPNRLIKISDVASSGQYFDSHCHLQLSPLFELRHNLIQNAMSLGISRISICGVCPGDDWNKITTLCAEYPDFIVGNFGLHPWWIRKHLPLVNDDSSVSSEKWTDQLEQILLQYPKAGIGECGLDKKIDVTIDEQDTILTQHLQLARKYKRPITIHCVGYWGKLLEVLKREFELSNKANRIDRHRNPPLVLHSCNSMPVEMVPQFQKVNCPVYFSLSAGGSFEKSSKLIRAIPRELLLLETDSPDQLNSDLKGRLAFNEPCLIRHYCDLYAQVLGMESDELAQQLLRNNLQVFDGCL